MKQMIVKIAFLIVLGGGFLATMMPHAHAQGCLSPREARQAVNSGKAAPLSRVTRNIKKRTGGGDIVGANLCRQGRGLVYIVTVLRSNGSATRVVADARSGRILGR